MLVAREDLHPALVNLLLDAAREIHGGQGYFEAAGEFPGTTQVDLPVSSDADRHRRFGPSLLHRYLPFWIATVVERTIILVVPLLVVLIPLLNFLPQFLRWRVRSRIYPLVRRARAARARHPDAAEPLPLDRWRRDLARIEQAAAQIRAPASYGSEAYTLREHIGIVRREIEARVRGEPRSAPRRRRARALCRRDGPRRRSVVGRRITARNRPLVAPALLRLLPGVGEDAHRARKTEEAAGERRRKAELGVDHGGRAVDVHRNAAAFFAFQRSFDRAADSRILAGHGTGGRGLVDQLEQRAASAGRAGGSGARSRE